MVCNSIWYCWIKTAFILRNNIFYLFLVAQEKLHAYGCLLENRNVDVIVNAENKCNDGVDCAVFYLCGLNLGHCLQIMAFSSCIIIGTILSWVLYLCNLWYNSNTFQNHLFMKISQSNDNFGDVNVNIKDKDVKIIWCRHLYRFESLVLWIKLFS